MIHASPVRSKLLLTLSLLAGVIIYATGQINAPEKDFQGVIIYADTITLPDTTIIDTITTDPFFVIHSPDPDNQQPLALSATSAVNADFYWYLFDTISHVFTEYDSLKGRKYSIINDIKPGYYKVRIVTGSSDTSFTAWIFRDTPDIRVVDEDNDGKIDIYQYTCDYLLLKGIAQPDTLRYYDFSDSIMCSLPNTISFAWSCDNQGYEIFGATRYLNLYIYNSPPSSKPPTKDTKFTLTGTDSYGLRIESDILYESIHVKADFGILLEDEEKPGTWTEAENPEGEAPLEVKFYNLSENGEEYYWTFIDSAKTGSVEMDTTFELGDTLSFKYYIPNYYYPSMVAMSSAGCLDSLKMTQPIHVLPSELKVPNVFSPDGDGHNEYFTVYAKSLKEFKVTIFNRWGNLVYEHTQTEEMFEWEGWDGTLHGKGNAKCQPGVYYYVIEAIGWDKKKYRGKLYRGFVYLFRSNE